MEPKLITELYAQELRAEKLLQELGVTPTAMTVNLVLIYRAREIDVELGVTHEEEPDG